MAWIKTYINLNILECKYIATGYIDRNIANINLNILECKYTYHCS